METVLFPVYTTCVRHHKVKKYFTSLHSWFTGRERYTVNKSAKKVVILSGHVTVWTYTTACHMRCMAAYPIHHLNLLHAHNNPPFACQHTGLALKHMTRRDRHFTLHASITSITEHL